jgi:hypothetical protein
MLRPQPLLLPWLCIGATLTDDDKALSGWPDQHHRHIYVSLALSDTLELSFRRIEGSNSQVCAYIPGHMTEIFVD